MVFNALESWVGGWALGILLVTSIKELVVRMSAERLEFYKRHLIFAFMLMSIVLCTEIYLGRSKLFMALYGWLAFGTLFQLMAIFLELRKRFWDSKKDNS